MSDTKTLEGTPPIDLSAVLGRIGGDTSFLQDLLNLYFQEFGEKQERLQEAVSRGDATEIHEIGHSLKGASANLSLTLLQRLSWAIELAGREKDLDKARRAVGALEEELKRLKAFLERHPLKDLG